MARREFAAISSEQISVTVPRRAGQVNLLKFCGGKMSKKNTGVTICFEIMTEQFGDLTAVDKRW